MGGKVLEDGSAAGRVLFLTALGTVSQLLGFGYRVALSWLVGAEVMGLYQLVMPVYSVLLSMTAVGLTSAVSNLTAQYLAWENSRGAEQVLRTCLRLFFALLLPLGAAVFFCFDPISVYFLGDARTQLGLLLLVPCVALTGVENLHKHFFYGAGLVRAPAVVELCEQVVRTGAVLGLLVCFLPQYPERVVGLIVTGMVLCEVFSSLTLVVLYRRTIRRMGRRGGGERGRVRRRRVLGIALPVGATSLLGNWMGAANATLIPRKLVEGGVTRGAAMSEFGVVCGMTMPMLALPTVFLGAMNLVLVPKLARSAALGRQEEIRRRAARAMSALSVLILPSMALMTVIGADLGGLMFRQEGVGEYLIPLAVVMVLSCYESTLGAVLSGVGRQGLVALISILCSGVQLAFTVAAVPLPGVGMGGYVAGALVSTLLGLALCAWMAVRHTGLKLRLFQWLAAPGLAALLMALCSNLLFRALKDSGVPLLWACLGCAGFGGVLYLAALSAQGVQLRELFRLR